MRSAFEHQLGLRRTAGFSARGTTAATATGSLLKPQAMIGGKYRAGPFPNVATHVIEPKLIGAKTSHGTGPHKAIGPGV